MRRLTAALAGLLASGLASLASAADLPLPPAPPLEPVVAADFGGWYIRGDIGAGFAQIHSQSSTFDIFVPDYQLHSSKLSDSFFWGVGAGYQFNSWFRADITGEWRNVQGYRAYASYRDDFALGCAGGRCGDRYFGKYFNNATFMANGYVDLGTWYGITPYLGAGLGTANVRFGRTQDFGTDPAAAGYGVSRSSSNWGLAWALMAGFSYSITPNLLLDVGYRYIDMGSVKGAPIACLGAAVCANEVKKLHVASNDVRVGLRWLFGAPLPVEPPPPIVRKY